MRIAYLECFSGISGDMLLGAMMSAGAPTAELAAVPEKLGLTGVSLKAETVKRSQIAAMHVRVEEDGKPHPHHRSLSAIEKMIGAARLPDRVRGNAIAIFRRLGAVEAGVHGVPLENVHFHEVGAIDSLVDIVGACAGVELLGIEKLYCSALNVGGGTVQTEHGLLPAPAPATVDLLKAVGAPVYSSGPQMELVTPTGAAFVATLAAGFGAMPAMKLLASGLGAGTKDVAGRPNVLRLFVGEADSAATAAASASTVCVLEANLDDMNPQIAGHLVEQVLAAGALDVYFAPVQMKKGRPGLVVCVIAEPADEDRLARLLFRETSTIGVRIHAAERRTLDRTQVPVETDYGPLRVKVSRLDGEVINFAPEYEDCRRVARERDVPLKTVLAEASFRYLQKFGKMG